MTDLKTSHTDLIEDEKLLQAVAWISSTENGRYYFSQILAALGVRQSPFHPEATVQSFAAGMQSAAFLHEALLMKAAPEHYILMLKEQVK
jgi:hypothetical protein